MEVIKKCSNKNHSEVDARNFCIECNLYLCNKCTSIHIEYLDSHHIINLDKQSQDIFIGLCNEQNHKNELEFYCKNHNKLCCAACLSKIKGKGNGQHFECDVCLIKEIEKEKRNKLKENIVYLGESLEKIEESIKKLKDIFEKINESKEEIKLKIAKIFTKIRTMINEREDAILLELDNIYDNTFFKEDLIKKGEKIPNQIKRIFEKGKLLEKEWDINDNKLIEKINDCINIENSIKNIIEINENIKKCNSQNIKIKFLPESEQNIELEENIKKFGEILKEEHKEKDKKAEKKKKKEKI